MRARWISALCVVFVLTAGAAWAQEQRPGWLGVDAQDVTREEADKLGWEAPRGTKVVRLAPGSPAASGRGTPSWRSVC